MSGPPIARVILYVRDIPTVAGFYERFFSMKPLPGATDGWVELGGMAGSCTIALHQAAKSQKSGAAIKLVFGVTDVEAFVQARKKEGLKFGVIHRPDGFEFSNTKDPAGNSISVSSRGLRNERPRNLLR
jgi:predicted enzyme related to lactoylglutathione lyase